MSFITLTTDFGSSDSYVAQMKGVILRIAPSVPIVDVAHSIPPQDVARGASVLEDVAAVFPPGTIHVAVIDPGVGSERALLAAEAGGQRFLAPDNGLLSRLLHRLVPNRVHRLDNTRYWRPAVSATFHGRDILAPVAAHWSLGADLADFGPAVDTGALVSLPMILPCRVGDALLGRVESIDAFGNAITNIDVGDLPPGPPARHTISCGAHRIVGVSRCYSEQRRGGTLALIGSSGRLEIAVNCGNAAKELGISPGDEVRLIHAPE